MAKQKTSNETSNVPKTGVKSNTNDNSSVVLGILTLIVIVGIFFALLAALSNVSRIKGELTVADEQTIRRGNQCTFIFRPDGEIADGTEIVWYANGEEVDSCNYTTDQQLCLNYTPQTCGQLNLQAKIGDKYSQNSVFWVSPPQLTLTAPTITVTYGEQPTLDYTCNGLVCDDCKDDIDCHCKLTDGNGKEWQICQNEFLPVGTYYVDFDNGCCYKDYETQYVRGIVTVIPRKLNVVVADKQYDRTTDISADKITLDGIYANDSVTLQFDKAEFNDRKVGNDKAVKIQNLRLCGEDSANYFVDEEEICGRITPKVVTPEGITVLEKRYDGTTKATIDKLGKLVGIVDGDSVAIGSILARFDSANIGTDKKVSLYNIVLVGADKDNYVVGDVTTLRSAITQ